MLGQFLALAVSCAVAHGNPLQPRAATPTLKSATEVGYVASYPTLNRDSMVGTRVGNRYFWISRDATNFDGQSFFIISSAASWSPLNSDGSPQLSNGNLTTYGNNNNTSYLKTSANQYPPNGFGPQAPERWINWPDTPPLPVNAGNGRVKLYTWTRNIHNSKQNNADNGNPPTVLYRSDYDGSGSNILPPVTTVDYAFWPPDGIPFGNYGWVISPTDGFAYLYGHTTSGTVLARVDPAKIEDKSAYCYYTLNAFLPFQNCTVPSFSDSSRVIPNAGSGDQGTFYYSSYFASYLWIGGIAGKGSGFFYTTAPNPWGPWQALQHLYTFTPGTDPKGYGYSWQAHPGMSLAGGNGTDIWLTFTRVRHYYENVLLHVTWQ